MLKAALGLIALTLGLIGAAVLLPNPEPTLEQRVQALARQLDDPSFEARQQAEEDLRQLGIAVVPLLEKELQKNPPLEVARRMQGIVQHLGKISWHKQDAAFLEARRTGKPVLVFSTIGEANGFS